jgi:hypothetical protein
LNEADIQNQSQRPRFYFERYGPELERLVADKDHYLIEQFEYDFLAANMESEFPKTNFFKHLGTADVDTVIERIKEIPESLWISENAGKPNKYEALSDTRHIMFRFFNGGDKVFDYDDHPLWRDWQDVLLPIMEQAAERLGYKDYRFPRVMFARIPAGCEIMPHTDDGASYYINKIHVPLITNPKTTFHIGRQARHLSVGEIVEVNNKRKHSVTNEGELDRIHFIFECYNMDDYGRSG